MAAITLYSGSTTANVYWNANDTSASSFGSLQTSYYWSPAPTLSWTYRWLVVARPEWDRQMLARARPLALVEPRAARVLSLPNRPELVRRAPAAGRPSGWRRARKAGRIVARTR